MENTSDAVSSSINDVAWRRATPEDTALLTSLGAKAFYDTFVAMNTKEDMDQYLQENFSVDRLATELNDSNNSFFIAVSNGQPAGYAKTRKIRPPEELNGANALEIERLYAMKDFIGRNVGSTLMQCCLQHARDEGFHLVWLGVWERNHRAISFYEKWGFEKFGSHPFMLGKDMQTDLLFKKYLTPVS
jgi:ribosomal protein S18 acetylase RimI-like enzyme